MHKIEIRKERLELLVGIASEVASAAYHQLGASRLDLAGAFLYVGIALARERGATVQELEVLYDDLMQLYKEHATEYEENEQAAAATVAQILKTMTEK